MPTCKGDTSRARIEFPAVGVEVFAHEADIRRERRKFAVAEMRISRAAGELIAGKVPDFSVANVYIGDELAHRMMYAGDSLEFETTLSENDVADLVLKDAGKILNRGSITERYGNIQLDTIIEDILQKRNDPHDVIVDYEFVSPSDITEGLVLSGSIADVTGGDDSPFFAEVDPDLGGNLTLTRTIDSFFGFLDEHLGTKFTADSYTGFDFENETPLSALNTALNEFELDWWVTNEGVLRIGFDGTAGQIAGIVGGQNQITLNKYAITSDPDQVNAVYVEGPQRAIIDRGSSASAADMNTGPVLQMLAEAKDPSREGSLKAIEVERNVQSLQELEEIAIRQLTRETLDQASGSVTINGLASEDKPAVARLDVGDILSIDESVNVRCGRALITGDFLVRGVHQRLNEQRGWIANVEVAQIPDMSEVVSRSVYYDPEKDKEYESLEQYRNETNDSAGGTFGIQP
jgi:hypothetical protein